MVSLLQHLVSPAFVSAVFFFVKKLTLCEEDMTQHG